MIKNQGFLMPSRHSPPWQFLHLRITWEKVNLAKLRAAMKKLLQAEKWQMPQRFWRGHQKRTWINRKRRISWNLVKQRIRISKHREIRWFLKMIYSRSISKKNIMWCNNSLKFQVQSQISSTVSVQRASLNKMPRKWTKWEITWRTINFLVTTKSMR